MAALTKAEMAEALFDQLGLNKREARELVDLFFEEIRAALSSGRAGEIVRLRQFRSARQESAARAEIQKPAKRFPSARVASLPSVLARN